MEWKSVLQSPDYVVIAIYFLGIMSYGMYSSTKAKKFDSLFLANRSIKWYNIGLSIFGTNVNPSMMIAHAGMGYASGIAAANFEWMAFHYLILLGMVFAPHYLNIKISTTPEFTQRRFGTSTYNLFSWYMLFTTVVIWLSFTIYTGALLFSQIVSIPLWISVILLTAIATSFTYSGGLLASVMTGAIQSIMMILGALILVIVGLVHIGGFENLINGVPDPSYWDLFLPNDNKHLPWLAVVLSYPTGAIWFWCADQTVVQQVLGAKSIREGQLGTVFTGFLKILPPFLYILPGIMCVVLHPNLDNQDEAFFTMVSNHLPVGMIGFMVAVLIAALISTISAALNSFSTIFTLNVYVKHIRPQSSAAEQKWIGRLSVLGAACITVVVAIFLGEVGQDAFTISMGLFAFVGPPMSALFLMGMLWKRTTKIAANATIVGGVLTAIVMGLLYFNHWPSVEFWPHPLYVQVIFFVFMIVFMTVISLLTRKSPEEENFPSIRETTANLGGQTKDIWGWWIFLSFIMLTIYIIFN